jgi:hypothetical protein
VKPNERLPRPPRPPAQAALLRSQRDLARDRPRYWPSYADTVADRDPGERPQPKQPTTRPIVSADDRRALTTNQDLILSVFTVEDLNAIAEAP